MQMNMSTGYKPEFKELGLKSKLQYHQKSIHKKKETKAPTRIYQSTCARSFLWAGSFLKSDIDHSF